MIEESKDQAPIHTIIWINKPLIEEAGIILTSHEKLPPRHSYNGIYNSWEIWHSHHKNTSIWLIPKDPQNGMPNQS